MELRQIAAALGCEVHGDASLEITGVAGMEKARPGQLTFLANPKYAHKVKHSAAGAILVSQPLKDLPITSVVSSNPYLDFARALAMFYQPPMPEPGIHSLAFVHETAIIGENASIGPFASIGRNVSHRTQCRAASARRDLRRRADRRRFLRPLACLGPRVLPASVIA